MFWWYLTRATGIVATVLLCLSLVWGLRFSARETGRRARPAWWLDLHNTLGGLALAFTVAHIVAVVIDPNAGFSVVQAMVPGQATDTTTAIGYGIVSAYLLVLIVATSWPRLRFGRRIWRAVHLTSIPAAVLTVAHAFQSGSDRGSIGFQLLLAGLAGLFMYQFLLRAMSVHRRREERRSCTTLALN